MDKLKKALREIERLKTKITVMKTVELAEVERLRKLVKEAYLEGLQRDRYYPTIEEHWDWSDVKKKLEENSCVKNVLKEKQMAGVAVIPRITKEELLNLEDTSGESNPL